MSLTCLQSFVVSHYTKNNIPVPSGDGKAVHVLAPSISSTSSARTLLLLLLPALVQLPFSSLATSTYLLPLGVCACWSPGIAPPLALLDWPFSLSSGLGSNADVGVRLPVAILAKTEGRPC